MRIIYTRADGGVIVCVPAEGFRLATSVTFSNGEVLTSDKPQPVDQFLRRWPVPGAVVQWAETEDDWIARIIIADVPASATKVEVVSDDKVPADRTFRDAWTTADDGIAVDMAKAREIAHGKRRAAREVEFAPLDEVIAKQIPGNDAAETEKTRQVIRDKYSAVQESIDAAETPEDLKIALGIE